MYYVNANPIILFSEGCSMSSQTGVTLKALMQAHNVDFEPGHVWDSNERWNSTHFKYGWELERNNQPIAKILKDHPTLVGKLGWKFLNPEIQKLLLEMKARIVLIQRRNSLNVLLCMIHDCFGKFSSANTEFLNGSKSKLCFKRRSSPERTYVRIWDTPMFFKKLGRVVHTQNHHIKIYNDFAEQMEHRVANQARGPIYTEDLMAFTSRIGLNTSLNAWSAMFRQLGLVYTRSVARSVLEPHIGTHEPHNYQPVIHPLSLEEFERALMKSPYSGFAY
jgi:hypothetical protein